ncbi:MAG: hypothetical protein ABJA78_16450, partial [Ferruginibacter sp.]
MKILVVSATAMETAIFSTHYQNDLNKDKYSVEMLITGVGTVNTAYHLLKKVINNHFDIVIQAGIGGTFDKEIALGDVFFISED